MKSNRWSPIPSHWDTKRQVTVVCLGAFIGAFVGEGILKQWFPHANWIAATAFAFPFTLAWMIAVICAFRHYDRQRVRRTLKN
jgi:uncharacterized membrane protein YfcA